MLFLGGDHFVTYPAFTATAETKKRPLSLLYFDAHPDLYPEYDGDRLSHATVVSRILEDREHTSGNVCYIGIRASTKGQDVRIKESDHRMYTTHDVQVIGSETIASSIIAYLKSQPVYLSLDLDCLDPAFAPGVGNPQPGGMSTRQVIEILRGLQGLNVVACDIVEYSPRYDSSPKATGFTSAIIIKELMGLMARSHGA
jgi:agmatinase